MRRSNCLNCGAPAKGPYCHICGQRNDDLRHSVFALAEDFFENALSFDFRAWRTIGLLILKPGVLTRRYLAGQRARFVPPVRLYIIITLGLFLILAFSDVALVTVSLARASGSDAVSQRDAPVEVRLENQATDGEDADITFFTVVDEDQERAVLISDEEIAEAAAASDEEGPDVRSFLSALNDIVTNPRAFNRQFNEWLPRVMIIALPLFALALKLVYIRRRQLLLHHLVFSLHLHSFIFLYLALLLVLVWVSRSAFSGSLPALAFLYGVLIYLLVAVRNFYGQGWIRTVLKTSLLSVMYLFILVFSLGGAVALNRMIDA